MDSGEPLKRRNVVFPLSLQQGGQISVHDCLTTVKSGRHDDISILAAREIDVVVGERRAPFTFFLVSRRRRTGELKLEAARRT